MSVQRHVDDVELDDQENAAVATITLKIEDLFDRIGELRLWEDDVGWDGYLLEDGAYYWVVKSHDADDWITKYRVGEQAVRDAVKDHIEKPEAGGAGNFVRRCTPP